MPETTTEQIDAKAIAAATQELVRYGQIFYAKGWNLATSSNFSAVLANSPLRLLMTASGRHKGELNEGDFVIIDEGLQQVHSPNFSTAHNSKPSAEASLHVALAKRANVKAILHTHSVWSTIASERFFSQGYVELRDFEMLKALNGVTSHEAIVRIPILENSQDMNLLAEEVTKRLDKGELEHAFLLRGHGLYTWASSLSQVRNQIEALEFLFEVIGRTGGSF